MKKYFRWALLEIRHSPQFALFFILNLSIGLTGFLCLDAFKTSLESLLLQNSKSFLSADVAVSARRLLTAEEKKAVELAMKSEPTRGSGRTLEMMSMVSVGSASRLIQVKVIDDSYPLYGRLRIDSGDRTPEELQTAPRAWVYPELLTQLGLKKGDRFRLGTETFEISGVVTEDGSQTLRFASLAPKIFVGAGQIEKTNLISRGTTLTETLLFKLLPGAPLEGIVRNLKGVLSDPGIQVTDHETEAEETGRPLKYLGDYLGLVSLVALFLAVLGAAYLFRSYVFSRYYSVAVFNVLGLQKNLATRIYLLQLTVLGVISAFFSLLAASALLPVLASLLQAIAPVKVEAQIHSKTILIALAMGALGSFLVGGPFLRPARRVRAGQLLQEFSSWNENIKFGRSDALAFIPGLVFFWLLCVWQAKSLEKGSLFLVMFGGSLVVLFLVGWVLLSFFSKFAPSKPWPLRHAVLGLSRKKSASISALVALGLGALLMNILPQVKAGLRQDLETPRNLKLPALFLFDIQEEQLDSLQSYVQKKGLSLQQLSPLVRARILKLNGEKFERSLDSGLRTREEEQEARFRNRGVNLSYRDHLSEAESLISGRDFTGAYNPDSSQPAELSVEERFARQLGLKLGDQILFDVQGVEFLGVIVNLRRVRWNSFQPNFFVLLQPGVLEEAPKTFLASLPAMDATLTQETQNGIVQSFPNISVIDVARLIQKILELTDQMSWSLQFMAILSLVAGFVVLFSVALYEIKKRTWDLNMMKVCGASSGEMMFLLLFEFGFLGFLAATLGTILSFFVSLLLSKIIFSGTAQVDWGLGMLGIVGVTLLSMILVLGLTLQVTRRRPVDLLQA